MTRRALVALLILIPACSGDDDAAGPTTSSPPSTTSTSTTGPIDPADAAAGVGDPYYPDLGGAGIDVQHYDLALDVSGDGRRIDATATIELVATDDLASFAFDLLGLEVGDVTVDGEAATVERSGRDLRIRPATPITEGSTVTVVVPYAGEPQPVETPSLGPIGWLTVPGGGSYVIGQPDGAATWFPANDHPTDKATFAFELTVPDGVEAVANGVLVERTPTVWRWAMDDPMAPYLAQVAVGQLTLTSEPGPGGVELRDAVADDAVAQIGDVLGRHADMLAFFVERFGPYPFDAYGALVVDVALGLALESQTFSLFGPAFIDEEVLAHELVHQWFGNSVSVASWDDIWLSEGAATYAQWLWTEQDGGGSVEGRAAAAHAQLASEVAPGDPGPARLFDPAVYERGALTLYALGARIGEDRLGEVLRRWATERAGSTGSTEDFVALAEDVAGEPLDDLFAAWLAGGPLPPLP